MQAQRTLPHDLNAVIEQADNAEKTRPRGSGPRDERADQPGDNGRQDDDDATHRGGSALRQVLSRPILTDELTVLVQHQETDEQRCAHHGQRHRDDERSDKTNHRVIPFSRRMSATCHECEPKEPFTRTTAPSSAN